MNKYLEKIAASYLVDHPSGDMTHGVTHINLDKKEYEEFAKDFDKHMTPGRLGTYAGLGLLPGSLAGGVLGGAMGNPIYGAIMGGLIGASGGIHVLNRRAREHAIYKHLTPKGKEVAELNSDALLGYPK